MMDGRLPRVSTSDALVTLLRDEVLNGVRPLGSRLTEAELVQAYGVSRHSIRIALNDLASLGLVVLKPHKGARVRQMAARDIEDLYRVRWLLESEAIAHAAIEPATWEDLGRRVTRLEQLPADAPWSVVALADWDFHHEMVIGTGNTRLVRTHRLLEAETLLSFIQGAPEDDVRAVVASHVSLLEAIRSGDSYVATEALRDHLEESMRSLVTRLRPGAVAPKR